MQLKTIKDLGDINGKVVMLRADLSVPVDENLKVTNDARIVRTVPTIKALMDKGAKVVVTSHFGRPKGQRTEKDSLKHIAGDLEKALGKRVVFVDDCIGEKVAGAVKSMSSDEVLLLENLRFYKEEEAGDEAFASQLVAPVDAYVSDAFSTSHRAHASMVAAAKLKPAVAGLLMEEEVNALASSLSNPKRPLMAIAGGAKVDTKIDLLENLVKKVDYLVVAGCLPHTFLKASGVDTITDKNSRVELDKVETAQKIIATAKANNCTILLPVDLVATKEFKENAPHEVVDLQNLPSSGCLMDIGPKSIKDINDALDKCQTLVWNGPLGVFEMKPFDNATNTVAEHAVELTKRGKLMSVGGGGDTVTALEIAGLADKFSYISTAGGAFLEWMEGKALPGVEVLKK